MKIDKKRYTVMRTLREKYDPEGGVQWSMTADELAKETGLSRAQATSAGTKLAAEGFGRLIQSTRTIKSGANVRKKPLVGFALNRKGALELERMQSQLDSLGVKI